MSEYLPYDDIEMWHGHPDLCMDKLADILNTEDDILYGYFVEVDLKYPDKLKQKTKSSPLAPGIKFCPQDRII